MPFACARLRLPYSPVVHCFDASETGLGVEEKSWPLDRVESAAEYDDRWRFKPGFYTEAAPRQNSVWSLEWGNKQMTKQVEAMPSGWVVDHAFS